MNSESGPPESGPIRVVDLQVGGGRRLHLGGGLACVIAASHERGAVARWIATAIVGPRPAGSDGTIEVDGRSMSVRTLPSPLLPSDAEAVIGIDLLRTLWRADCTRRREELAATHAFRRLEGHRIAAALERVRVGPGPEAAPPTGPLGMPPGGIRRDADAEMSAFRAKAQAFGRVETLLAAIDTPQLGPTPEALQIADSWDANVALLRQRQQLGNEPALDVDAAEQRARHARTAVATASGVVRPEARSELERLHAAVVRAQGKVFKAHGRQRAHAVSRYESAVAAERRALADAGVDSYAALWLGATTGVAHDDGARRAPDEELHDAVDQLSAAQRNSHLPRREELLAREEELRARARAVLGREPGPDVARDLRAQRAAVVAGGDLTRQLADVLRGAGVEVVGDDIVGQARAFLETPPVIHVPQPDSWPKPGPAAIPPSPEVAALEKQSAEHDQVVGELEAEITRFDSMRDKDLARMSAGDFARVMQSMLDAYRGGDLLDGRLPLVLDGVLDGLGPDVLDAAVVALASADTVQVIVVTAETAVTTRVGGAGGAIVSWSEPALP